MALSSSTRKLQIFSNINKKSQKERAFAQLSCIHAHCVYPNALVPIMGPVPHGFNPTIGSQETGATVVCIEWVNATVAVVVIRISVPKGMRISDTKHG
jgi:hypothetical protein